MVDVWEQLMGESNDAGWTVNIYENPIAKQVCPDASQERLDQIFKAMDPHWLESKKIRVSGKSRIDFSRPPTFSPASLQMNPGSLDPIENLDLCLSDHFTLECKFRILPHHQVLDKSPDFQLVTQHDAHKKDDAPTNGILLAEGATSPIQTSAVVIIPPVDLLPRTDSIRSQFDPSFPRWPPAVNLMYDFIPGCQ